MNPDAMVMLLLALADLCLLVHLRRRRSRRLRMERVARSLQVFLRREPASNSVARPVGRIMPRASVLSTN